MAIIKNTNTNYVINTPRGQSSNITLNTDAVYIPGNLVVLGATTSITTTDTAIKDNTVILNSPNPLAGVGNGTGTAGILVDRGTLNANVELRWSEQVAKWQVGTVGNSYANILTSTTGSTALTQVFDDKAPVLGGDLNVGEQNIYSTSGNVMFGQLGVGANVGFFYSPGIPPAPPSSQITAIYGQPPGAGSSGLYTVDIRGQNDELITKRRAIGFSLLL
jgi:hypothetical protein